MRSLAILLVLFGSVFTGYSQRHIIGDGSDYKETRSLTSFDRVHLACHVEVVVVKGDSFSIRLEGERNIIEVLETDVKGGELNIHYPLFYDLTARMPVRGW